MALQTRQSNLFAAEDWKVVYETFRQIDLTSFDYDTIRTSMIDHLRVTYPDSFNDWIENDEFIFILDTISYLGQNLSFRMDLNTRENFIDTAERRESILRLASMLSYNPRRNYPSRGLVKINQISTSHDVRDSNGKSLAGVTVRWNDPLNPDWYEQFILIMNSSFVSSNPFGNPVKRFSDGSINTQIYQMNTNQFSSPAEKFSSTVNGQSMNFEIVNPDIDDLGVFVERHPEPQATKHIIYRTDGNGFSSPDTGFFLFFKQGALKFDDYQFDLEIENRTVDIDVNNINELDVWVQQISDDGVVTDKWVKVPSTQNIVYNEIDKQETEIYSIITKENDRISIRFPDSSSGTIPRGAFRIWYRTSNGQSYTIRTNDMQNKSVSYNYTVQNSTDSGTKTLDMQFSLQYQVQNAQEQETTEQIRLRAPQNYYTQNRLITGEDYNVGPLKQGNVVLKSKAINRTYSGHSRFIDINDPTGKYQNVDVFSENGVIYGSDTTSQNSEILPSKDAWETVVIEKIQPLINNFTVKTLYQEIGTTNIFWNTATDEQNRKNLVQVQESITWDPSAGKTPSGAYGTFAPSVSSFTPIIEPGAVLLFEKQTTSERIWTSVVSYNSSIDEYALSSPISGSGWEMIQYYPNLRNVFNQQEVSALTVLLENSENFGLYFDLADSTWKSLPLTKQQITTYINNAWEDLPAGDIPLWGTAAQYSAGNIVTRYNSSIDSNELLIALEDHTTGVFDETQWKVLGNNVHNTWVSGTTYTNNDIAVYEGFVFQVSDDGLIVTTTPPYDTNTETVNPGWSLISSPSQNPNIPIWVAGTTYGTDNLVRYGITIYQAISTFVGGSTFDPKNWAKLYGSVLSVYDPLILSNFTSKTWDFISLGRNYIFYGDDIGFYFTKLEDVPDINTGLAQGDLIKVLRSNYNPLNSGLGYDNDVNLDITENVYQIDGYTDYTRIKVAPDLDIYQNPLDPDLMNNIISGSAVEDVFWRRNDDNTESYMDLMLVKRDLNEKIDFDPLVQFFLLQEYEDASETYGKRQSIYGSSGTIFAYLNENGEYEYYELAEIRDESDSISIDTFETQRGLSTFTVWLSQENLITTDVILHYQGRVNIQFLWKHYAPSNHRIDPAITNIHDIYVLTTAYNTQVQAWAAGDKETSIPRPPTSTSLRSTFNEVEQIKAISDTVIWHSAKYVPLFGSGSSDDYKATFNVVRAPGSQLSDDEIRQQVISLTRTFFDIENWDFGESFFFTELSAYIHQNMVSNIASVVIVPINSSSKFGTLFEISSDPDEVFISTASVEDVVIVDALTANNIRIGF